VSSLLDTTTASASTGEGSLLSGDASTVYKDVAATGGWPVLRGALKLRRTQVGLSLVGLIVLIALFGPFVAPHSATDFVAPPYSGPSSAAPLGADTVGRDVLSRTLHGGLSILAVSAAATILGVGVGAFLGIMAGYRRGVWDDVIMRSLDVLLAIPAIVLAMLLMSVVGIKQWLVVLAIAASHVPQTARVLRGATVQLTGRDFILYAETLGVKRRRIILGELLPSLTAPLTVEFGLRMTYSIGWVASLAFLGFGPQPPAANWGLMINENRSGLTIQPWGVLAPIILIALLTIGTNLVADGIARTAAGVGRQVEADT
jgi:peptide/nickel transport system permease protein